VYPVQIETAQRPKVHRNFEPFASTEPRFGFDAYCTMQLLLVHEPVASGAVIWFGQYPDENLELELVKPFALLPNFQSWAASGALTLDAGLLFTDAGHRAWSTPLKASWHTLWLDVARHNFRKNWQSLAEMVMLAPAQELLPVIATRSKLPPPPLALPVAMLALPAAALAQANDIARPYSDVLDEVKNVGPWSWKKLGKLLGTSHTQLRRIVSEGAVPSDELAPRIDELHRFTLRLARLTRGDVIVTKRLLTTPRERDQQSVNSFLERHDYRNAFRTVMEVASPRMQVAAVEAAPRRWFNEPSRDLYDNEVAPEE
jgi:hypothetical protein